MLCALLRGTTTARATIIDKEEPLDLQAYKHTISVAAESGLCTP
jgi:hypothetical protein